MKTSNNKKVSVHDPVQEQKEFQKRMLIFAVCVVILSAAMGFLYWKTTMSEAVDAGEVETESTLEGNSAE
ncbi:MAG: hypothetical protein LUE29_10375 [Lachnospiraceae bacterium]|nr:hypothetical protein [Lachnospiraceae bacterium]